MVFRLLKRASTCIPAALLCLMVPPRTGIADTAALSPGIALFNRCYAQLTRTRAPRNHPLLQKVAAGTLSATNACVSVLEGARLKARGTSDEGYIAGKDKASGEALAVLRTFNDVHRTWFPSDVLNRVFPIAECQPLSDSVHDGGEAALHVTRALFSPGVKFSDIVTSDGVMEALRTTGLAGMPAAGDDPSKPFVYNAFATPAGFKTENLLPIQLAGWTSATNVPGTVPGVQKGTLLGVRRVELAPPKAQAKVLGYATSYGADGNPQNKIVQGALNQSFGAGLLGTPSYLTLNMGRSDTSTMNGGIRMSRRWSKAVLNDLLCRNLPVLRTTDAQLYVETAAAAPPFRHGVSCMQCHGSMDPMAASIRNLALGMSDNDCNKPGIDLALNMQDSPQPAETGVVDDDPLYFQRPPTGRLNFRSYDGTLVNIPVQNLAQLGGAIASTNDLYVCAAKRYFEYFTGISVDLSDPGDPASPVLSAADLRSRNQVITLGLALKRTQNLEGLIQGILDSEAYQLPGQGK